MVPHLPHDDVRVRLAPSPIAGIGVFALTAIRTGTEIFANDARAIRWVSAAVLEQPDLQPWQRAFYDDFAIRMGDQLGCPDSFDLLTTGWFLNEPIDGMSPNVRATADFRFVAARNVKAGEELTISYDSFSR
ncbi:MAG: SET domain-containing protein [Sphingomonadaceae bacterium]|nr:SET domain-containing protein [Sphingomonadaceae bacterium]